MFKHVHKNRTMYWEQQCGINYRIHRNNAELLPLLSFDFYFWLLLKNLLQSFLWITHHTRYLLIPWQNVIKINSVYEMEALNFKSFANIFGYFCACHSQKGLFLCIFVCHFRPFGRTHVNLIFSVDKTLTYSDRMFMFCKKS